MISAAVANEVRQRAGGICEYCHMRQSQYPLKFHVEHIIALSHGGADELKNLALACPLCNWRKGTNLSSIDPDTGQVTRLFSPRLQIWNDHFSADGPRILAKTPEGRATIWALGINDADRLKFRALQ